MKKLAFAVLFAFILSAFSVLATVNIDSVSFAPATSDPGTTVAVTVTVSNPDTAAYGLLSVRSTNPFGTNDLGQVTSIQAGLAPNQSATATFNLNVPATQPAGAASATLTVSESSTNQDSGTYSITVNAKPSLTVTESSLTVNVQPGKSASKSFTVRNSGNVVLNNLAFGHERTEIKDSAGHLITLSFSPSTVTSLAIGATQTVTVSVQAQAKYDIKSESDKVKIDSTNLAASVLVPLIMDVKPLVCTAGNTGEVDINIVRPNSNDDFEAGTEIPVEVEVRNEGSRVHTFKIESVLFNLDENDKLDDFNDDQRINDGDKETFKFNLQLPSDTNDGDDVRLYVKAYDKDSEVTTCIEEDLGLDVQELENKVIVDSLSLSPDTPACSATVFGTLHVVNRDNTEQDVVVTIRSDELGIVRQLPLVTLQEGFRSGSDQFLQFSFKVPDNARAGQYTLNAIVNYEDGATQWQRTLNVRECSVTPPTPPSPPSPPPSPPPAPTPPVPGPTIFTGKSILDRFGEVPTSFWLLANIVLALAIFVLALAALRKR